MFLAGPLLPGERHFIVRDEVSGEEMKLHGEFEPPRGAGQPVLIFLHGLGSTRGEWAPLAALARERGWGTLAYDARGHGQSRATLTGKKIAYEESPYGKNPAFWKSMVEDLRRVMAALNREGIGPERLVLLGASLGANVCLVVSRDRPELAAAVLLSPGLNYAGVETQGVTGRAGPPLLLVAARPDRYAAQSARALAREAASPERVGLWMLSKKGRQGYHGTQLFNGQLEEKILAWVQSQLKKKE